MKKALYILSTLLIIACGTSNKSNKESNKPDSSQLELICIDSIKVEQFEQIEVVEKMNQSGSTGIEKKEKKTTIKERKNNSKSKPKSNTQKNLVNKNGQLIYSLPDTMKVGLTHRVVVRIINSKQESNINEGLSSSSEIIPIRTSATMQVEMIDANKAFSITSSNSQIQLVDSIEYTEWIFDVTPIKSGKHPLNIVSSIITPDGRKDKTYSNTVYVKMNIANQTKTFWQEEWKWIFTTLIIPLIAWWYKNRKKSKDAS